MTVDEAKRRCARTIMLTHSLSLGEATVHVERLMVAIEEKRVKLDISPKHVLDLVGAMEAT